MDIRAVFAVPLLFASPAMMAQEAPKTVDCQQITEKKDWTKNLAHDGWSTRELIQAANQGDFKAAMSLAKYWTALCEPGQMVSASVLEARFWASHWLEKAAATGHPAPRLYQEAMKMNETDMEDPDQASEEFRKFRQSCEKLAEQGDIESIEALGLFLPAQPDETIQKWFAPIRKKADEGNVEAKAVLGYEFIFGHSANESFLEDGLNFARQAAEAGNVSGMKTYGHALVLGLGESDKEKEGMAWLNKAAEAGHIDAMQAILLTVANVQSMTAQEQEDFKNREAKLIHTLCERGQVNILNSEGMKLIESGEAPQTGLKMLDKSADLGSFTALDALARYYEDDKYYVPANIGKSVSYAQRLVDLGGANGLIRLARCYENGNGTPKDETRAYKMISEARDAGLADAYVEQARMIIRGIGTARDPKKAFDILINLDNELSPPVGTHFLLGYLYESGMGTERDYQKAFDQYSKGHDAGDGKATNNLASMYEAGLNVRKDREQAMKLYEEAAKMGNEDAAANLVRLKTAQSTQ